MDFKRMLHGIFISLFSIFLVLDSQEKEYVLAFLDAVLILINIFHISLKGCK
jgi:hypothetical protein